MILFHGSYIEIKNPDLKYSRDNLDFGRGFYTTPIYEQAVKWCGRIKKRNGEGIVSQYLFDEKAMNDLNVLEFDSYSEEWIDFVLKCRRGFDNSDYDVVIGGVANDKVFNTVELYFDGLIDKSEALTRLKYEKPNLQICLRSENALRHLMFEGSESV